MSTPITFKRAICRSAAEVKSKEDKIVLVLLALNYSREIEKNDNFNTDVVDEYYDFLKENLYTSTGTVEDVIKAANLDFEPPVSVDEKSFTQVNDAPVSVSIDDDLSPQDSVSVQESTQESTQEQNEERLSNIKDYDWNTALSNSGSPSKQDKKTLKVSPIPDAILYGDLAAYGIPNLERIKLFSQIGDISKDVHDYDQVYDLGFVPRSFKLGNRDVVQHVDNEVEVSAVTTTEDVVPAPEVVTDGEVEVSAVTTTTEVEV